MKEEYIVRFQYQKDDGFYTTETKEVLVPIPRNGEEKNSHDKAEKIIRDKKYKNLTIISVTYC